MVKALLVIHKMLELIPEPDILEPECVVKLTSLVHFPNLKIKEEVGNIMILLSEELDDPTSLLEIQKFNLNKIENSEEQIEINFTQEPRKSKK